MRLALLLTSGLSLLLAGFLAVQLLQPRPDEQDAADATGVIPTSRARAVTPAQAAAPAPVLHGDEWVATILARPLFTRDRRPAGAAASVAASDAGGTLPRLTGIAISPDQRRAIFAGGENGKPIVVQEGGSIAGFTIQTIAPGGVTVQGPSGERTVALAFDPAPPTPRADAEQPQQGPQQGQPPGLPPQPYPLPYPQPGGPQNFLGGRPGPQIDPTGQPFPRPPFNRPRAERRGQGWSDGSGVLSARSVLPPAIRSS